MWPTRHVNFPYLAHEDYLYEVNFPHETCDRKKQNRKFSGSKMEILFPYIYIYIYDNEKFENPQQLSSFFSISHIKTMQNPRKWGLRITQ